MKPGHVRLLQELSDLLDTWQRYQPADPDALAPLARWEDDGVLRFPGGVAHIGDTQATWTFDSGAQMTESSPLQGDWSMRVVLADGTRVVAPAKIFGPRLCRPFARTLRAIARGEGKAQGGDAYTIHRPGGLVVSTFFIGRTLRFDLVEARDAKAAFEADSDDAPHAQRAKGCLTVAAAASVLLIAAAVAFAIVVFAWGSLSG